MLTDLSILPNVPAVAGLALRGFQGAADYPKMTAVLNGSKEADQIEDADTLETVTQTYTHLVNCVPYHDLLMVEIEGQVVGFARVFWREMAGGGRLYNHAAFLLPQWRGRGIGRALLQYCEQRAQAMAAEHAPGQALLAASLRALRARGMTEAALGVDTENLSGALRIYEALGFRAVRRNTLYRKPMR